VIATAAAWMRRHALALGALAAGSLVLLVATLAGAWWMVTHMPADYFARAGEPRRSWPGLHPASRAAAVVAKNVAGYVLVAAGMIMLVLPGQGVLTILAGVMLLDFPGKYRLERWLVSRAPVRRAIDALRARAGRPPLQLDR
jgi:hypothetical protein